MAITTNSDCQTLRNTAERLTKLFPVTEPVYSIGFQRWQKLTKKQRLALNILFNCDGEAIKEALQTKTASEILN